jgi:MFS transporter, DHA1 family, multidrug resistance protein
MLSTTIESTNPKRLLTFILLLVLMGQSAIDIYLPSFPAMVQYFHTSNKMVQLTLSTFMIGYACSQLIYGPLSDHFGRRPVLISGFSLFALTSLLCAISTSITALLIFRLLQGFGAGVSNVHQRAVMRDSFEGGALLKVASYMTVVWTLVPILAPIIGGYIQHYFNWRGNFLLLMAAELILLFAIIKWLPETRRKIVDTQLNFKNVFSNYKILLTNRIFLSNTICCGLLNSLFLIFNIAGPFLLQIELKLNPVQYGWTLIISTIGVLIGCYLNSILTQRYVPNKVAQAGFACILLSSLILLLLLFAHIFTIASLMLPLCGIFFGVGLIYAICLAGSMKNFPHMAASVGAAYGFLIFAIGGILCAIFSHFPATSPMPFAWTMLVLCIITIVIYFFLAHEKPVAAS